MHVDFYEAETNLAGLIDKVKAGDEVIITKDDIDVQLVVKPKRKKEPFPFGIMKGMKMVGWDDPLPPDIAEPFGMVDHDESTA
jgi:antitoxin (DNA-binding transcriptional repressor) of toxin-antitoxin stability system